MIESILLSVAANAIYDLSKGGIEFLNRSKSEYELELKQIIKKSIENFKNKFPNTDRTKTPFYDSQTLLVELLKFRFLEEFDAQAILDNVNNDSRLHPVSEDELLKFLEIFDSYLEKSESFRELAVDKNYKEEIFKISILIKNVFEKISKQIENQTKEIKDEISKLKITEALKNIWNQQIEEIKDNLKQFKVYTAKDRLLSLERQMSDRNSFSDKILHAKFLFLKAICEQEVNYGEENNSHHEIFIKAWKLNPDVLEYKIRAAVAFYSIKEDEEAKKLVDEILDKDPYNENAWMIWSFLSEDVISFIKTRVPHFVKQKDEFKVLAGYRLIAKKHIQKPSDLNQIGIGLNFQEISSPENITFNNKEYWRLTGQLCIAMFEEQYPVKHLFKPQKGTKNNVLFKLTNQILEKSVQAFKGTEIEEKYAFLKFQLHYTKFQISPNASHVYDMEQVYNSIKNRTFFQVFQLSQAIIHAGNEAANRKAIKIISEFGEDKNEILAYTKSTLHFILKEEEKSWESFKVFLDLNEIVDKDCLINIIQHLNVRALDKIENLPERISFILDNKEFQKPQYKDLLKLFAVITSNLPIDNFDIENKIDELTIFFDKKNSLVSILGALILKNKNYEKAENYLSKFTDLNSPDTILVQYCKALFYGRQKTPELLKILKHWRINFAPIYLLLDFELRLRIIQNNKQEVFEVAKKGVKLFPKDEVFLRFYFFGLAFHSQYDEAKNNVHLLKDIKYKNELNGRHVASILKSLRFDQLSLDLIYSLAKEKKNTKSRRNYFSLFLIYPDGIYKEYEKITDGSWVKIKIDDKIKIIEIDSRPRQNKIDQYLIGKAKGEVFTFPTPINRLEESQVTVLRIMDKYLALFEEILLEIGDPIRGIPGRIFDLPKDASVEEMTQVLIEEFGKQEDNRKAFINENLDGYYSGKLTFTEIIAVVFKRNYIEGYQYLTANQMKCFRALSPVFAQNLTFNDDTKFILDGTSLSLFYDLYLEFKILFGHKFIISSFLERELELIIEEIEILPDTNMSVNISSQGVIPTFYPDNFKEIRLSYFRGMLDWMNENCIVDFVDEKLDDLLEHNHRKGEASDGFQNIFIDNSYLINRKDYILLSNDLQYFKVFGNPVNQVVSPEVYLDTYHTDRVAEYSAHFSQKKYQGVNARHEILYDEFKKFLAKEENAFSLCLQNLHFGWNPNIKNVDQAILFLKEVYLLSYLSIELKVEIVGKVLSNLILGMEPDNIDYLIEKTKDEFEFMMYSGLDVLTMIENIVASLLESGHLKKKMIA